jgi:hypothetical protein
MVFCCHFYSSFLLTIFELWHFAVQEVLKCHKGTNSLDHTGLLFLSKHLRKYRYGFEYASLEVKDHLERVDFSDMVDTVIILLVYLICGFLHLLILFILVKISCLLSFSYLDMAAQICRKQKEILGSLIFI